MEPWMFITLYYILGVSGYLLFCVHLDSPFVIRDIFIAMLWGLTGLIGFLIGIVWYIDESPYINKWLNTPLFKKK
jgi:hypothetical protein